MTDHEREAEEYRARLRSTRRRSTERHRSPSMYPGTTNQDWRAEAACRGRHPGLFFPPESMGVPEAVFEVCDTCPVREPCLGWAIANSELGVWAATTRAQRDRIAEASA